VWLFLFANPRKSVVNSGDRYYENGCYQQRPEGAWLVVAPQYCGMPRSGSDRGCSSATTASACKAGPIARSHVPVAWGCEAGDRRACVQLGIVIGENQARRDAWRRDYPDIFAYERY
jgi:hypothetical protein